MISLEDIAPIGEFGKTHGIKGEINADFNQYFNIDECKCFILNIDGIFVPFFIEDYRFKSDSSAIILIDGINSELKARSFSGKTIYVNKELIETDDLENVSINYFIGFTILSQTGQRIGQIISINDSTANILFELDNHTLIPVAAMKISDVIKDTRTIIASIPDGLLNLD